MTLPWSRQQREWLHALGHPVLVLVGHGVEPAIDDPAAAALSAGDRTRSAAGTASGADKTGAGHRHEKTDSEVLNRALTRAARTDHRDAGQIFHQLQIDPGTLRDDPLGKRALWPRLRALRVRHRP